MRKHLSAALGSRSYLEQYVGGKVEDWVGEVNSVGDRVQKPQDMCTRALASVSCIPAFRFSKWRRTNQNLTRHCGRCQAAVLALRIFQHR